MCVVYGVWLKKLCDTFFRFFRCAQKIFLSNERFIISSNSCALAARPAAQFKSLTSAAWTSFLSRNIRFKPRTSQAIKEILWEISLIVNLIMFKK